MVVVIHPDSTVPYAARLAYDGDGQALVTAAKCINGLHQVGMVLLVFNLYEYMLYIYMQ